MATLDTDSIESWHAHVYFDASSRYAAWALREVINEVLDGRIEMGRFHEKPVGPHSNPSHEAEDRGATQAR